MSLLAEPDRYYPTYYDVIETVSAIECLIYKYQSNICLHIVGHKYPYTVEIVYLQERNTITIFTFHCLLYLFNFIERMLILSF